MSKSPAKDPRAPQHDVNYGPRHKSTAHSTLPFKQSPFPMVEGTSAHASALKHTGEDATHPGPGKEGDEGYHKGHGSAILRPLLPGKVKESEKEKESEL